MTRKVDVIPYCADWPAKFEAEAKALRQVFGEEMVSIHHFGSTSIPGVSAKPIIDMLVVVNDIAKVDELNPLLEDVGYHGVGEYGISGRRFFYKGTHEVRSHHLHVYQVGSPNILRHLVFRDYLRTHPVPALDYGRLKEALARRYPEDMDLYIEGKNEFVKDQEKCALEWWQEKDHQKEELGRCHE